MLYVFGESPVFDDIIIPLIAALKKRGLRVQRLWEISSSNEEDLFIMFGLNSYNGVMPKRYVSYQLEQTSSAVSHPASLPFGTSSAVSHPAPSSIKTGPLEPSSLLRLEKQDGETRTWFTDSYLHKLANSYEIWDYSLQNIINIKALFKQKNLELPRIKYVPITYLPNPQNLDAMSSIKDIDVLFYGSVNDRREKIINDLQTAGYRVHLGGYNLWGEERQKLIERAKIVLNIHFFKEPILETTRLAPLVSQGAFVVSEPSSDRLLDKFWSNMVKFCPYDEMVDTVSNCLKEWDCYQDFGKGAQQELLKHPFMDEIKVNLESIEAFATTEEVDTDNASEADAQLSNVDQRKKIKKASCKSQTLEDGSKAEILELIDISDKDLPSVSIITATYNRSELLGIALRNFHKTIYPFDKLEWVVLDDSDQEHQQKNHELLKGDFRIRHIQLGQKMSISEKRNYLVSEAISEYIVHMDDDDYYNPESVLARVKLLLKYQKEGIRCVGCTEIGIYHLLDNYSYLMDCGSYLSEASMAYHRSFWEDRPFPSDKEMAKMSTKTGEGALFLDNRLNEVIDMPFIFNFIAITHKKNVTGRLRTYNLDNDAKRNGTNFFNLWDIDTQLFFIKISRQCRS